MTYDLNDKNPMEISLNTIASEANREHQLATDAVCNALEHAARCGELLRQAKAEVGHGNFLPWLEANFAGSKRMAQNYMRLASNTQRVAYLGCDSLRQAIEALTDRSEPLTDQPKLTVEEAEAFTLDLCAKFVKCAEVTSRTKAAIEENPTLFRKYIGHQKMRWVLWQIDLFERFFSPDPDVQSCAIEEVLECAEKNLMDCPP